MAGTRFRHIPWRVHAVSGMIHQGGAAFLCAGIVRAIAAIGPSTQRCRSDEEGGLRQSCMRDAQNIQRTYLTASAA